jgi:hypothetical protein
MANKTHTIYLDTHELVIIEHRANYQVVFDYFYWDYFAPKNITIEQLELQLKKEVKDEITKRLNCMQNILRDLENNNAQMD